jgi:thioredoxin-like negative regulator of GroEL
MGRYLWLGNSIVFLAGLILNKEHILTTLDANQAVFVIFLVVGFGSIIAYVWFTILSRETSREFCMDGCMAACLILLATVPVWGFTAIFVALVAFAAWVKFAWDTRKLGHEWLVVVLCGFCWVLGASFYFYMPVAGMTNPPMEWGYPRTVEGFFHALTRGQYEKTNPTDIIHHPEIFFQQLVGLGSGIVEEFNHVYAFLALIPFLFFFKLHKRERAWLIGLAGIYLCLGVLLLILLNPPPDRQAQELNRVFFTASHTIVSLLVGYGLTLVAAYMATNYQRFRSWGIMGGAFALMLALYSFFTTTRDTFFGELASVSLPDFFKLVLSAFTNKDQYGLPVFAGLLLVGSVCAFLLALYFYRDRAPLALTLGLFALMPLHSILLHWSDNEERNHWFGYWFGHDMFTPPFKGTDGKPLYPQMTKDAILFGGTDPGRFCPTYMIFCDSFIPHDCLPKEDQNFDRRDAYIITQNALADATYLCYIRAQYNRSTQIDPPFFEELLRSSDEHEKNRTNFLARAVAPLDHFFTELGERVEMRRRTYTSWFSDKDFLDLPAFAVKLRPGPQQDPVSKFVYDNCSSATQHLLASDTGSTALRPALVADLNRLLERELLAKKAIAQKQARKIALAGGTSSRESVDEISRLDQEIAALSKTEPLYQPERFKQVAISEYLSDFIKQNPQSHTRIRLNRLLLEEAYPKLIAKSIGGVYPDREIYTPTPEDSQKCYQNYLSDAQVRLQNNQLKPGEDVRVQNNKVQITGQVAVMSINALLTKVIFDRNPKNEFFLEESYPLDWMYPYLTPFGIIMKLNRQPLAELTDDIVNKDHEFWSRYSERLVGNWLTYDTPLKDICSWVEKVYLRRNFSGFTGDRKFIRDDQAQKAFSKLRGSIAGVYAWRVNDPNTRSVNTQQRMFKEADFSFRQAFAFYPASLEAVYGYVNLLLKVQRFDDALLLASTALKLDPYNGQFIDLVKKLEAWKQQAANPETQKLESLRKAFEDHPTNFQAGFDLASAYLQLREDGQAVEVLDRILNSPLVEPAALRALMQAYGSINNGPRLQTTLEKLESMVKSNPADFQAAVGLAEAYRELQNTNAALQTLETVLANPNVDAATVVQVAQQFSVMMDIARLEKALDKLVQVSPESPEAWYDLSAMKAHLDKTPEALQDLRRALDLNRKRRLQDPKARDLAAEAVKDPRFGKLRNSPEFKQLMTPN